MDFAAARRNMVESQVRPNRVIDPRVIDAIAAVPRELFVPKGLEGVAYLDDEIALGNGRTLMKSEVFARLLQAAEIKARDNVLDVGAGTGYAAALLARLAGKVVALESDEELSARAQATLAGIGALNVTMAKGPLAEGHAARGPYDAIVAGGMLARKPDALLRQLAEGGRLVAVTANPGMGRATLWRRLGGTLSSQVLFDAQASLLPGFSALAGFVF